MTVFIEIFNFFIQLLPSFLGRGKIKIKAQTKNTLHSVALCDNPGEYMVSTLFVKITNVGERPVTVTDLLIEYNNTTIHHNNQFPITLNSSELFEVNTDITTNFKLIKRIIVIDSTDKKWSLNGKKIQDCICE